MTADAIKRKWHSEVSLPLVIRDLSLKSPTAVSRVNAGCSRILVYFSRAEFKWIQLTSILVDLVA